jgi:hypothetical protein
MNRNPSNTVPEKIHPYEPLKQGVMLNEVKHPARTIPSSAVPGLFDKPFGCVSAPRRAGILRFAE